MLLIIYFLMMTAQPQRTAQSPFYEPTKCMGSRCSFPGPTRPLPGSHTREPGMMYLGAKCCYG